eukprot:c9101_g1_i2.p1 GENE.c9101_g1_i2~~c9101_g1_i2.p1  ORF type:complete len:279 (+),score=83.27 c9101_g1_i2:527-1363(+)
MSRLLRVAVCQLRPGANKATNLEAASEAIKRVVKDGAKFVCLPECFNCPYGNQYFAEYAETVPGHTSSLLSTWAAENNIVLVGGSIPEREGDKLYNTALAYGPQGQLLAKHRKMHLFDIDVPGKIKFQESATLTAGNQITCFDTEFGRVGLAICYDIRFPLLSMLMRQQGCNVLVYPGAFNSTTGPLHWELLARARAVDTQSYVVMASVAFDKDATYPAWGYSMVVGPMGDIKASTLRDTDDVIATVDLNEVDTMRTNIPVSLQQRTDVYQLTEAAHK